MAKYTISSISGGHVFFLEDICIKRRSGETEFSICCFSNGFNKIIRILNDGNKSELASLRYNVISNAFGFSKVKIFIGSELLGIVKKVWKKNSDIALKSCSRSYYVQGDYARGGEVRVFDKEHNQIYQYVRNPDRKLIPDAKKLACFDIEVETDKYFFVALSVALFVIPDSTPLVLQMEQSQIRV